MRTLSVKPVDPARPDGPTDLDGLVVDGLESLRQRIVQRLRFPLGTWSLDTRRGTESVLGHGVPADVAALRLTDAIRDEGRDEVTGIAEVTPVLDHETRVLGYSVVVESIYGPMTVFAPSI